MNYYVTVTVFSCKFDIKFIFEILTMLLLGQPCVCRHLYKTAELFKNHLNSFIIVFVLNNT